MANLRDLITAYKERINECELALKSLEKEQQAHLKQAEDFEKEAKSLRQEFAAYLLPDVNDDALVLLSKQLGSPRLLGVKARIDRRLADSEAEREALEKDEEIRRYPLLYRKLSENMSLLQDAYEQAVKRRKDWENSPHFQVLEARGYFKPGYKSRISYWIPDWRDVSYLMAELEKADPTRKRIKNPREIRLEYNDVFSDDTNSMGGTIAMYNGFKAEIDALEAKKKHLADLRDAPRDLLGELYQEISEIALAQMSTMGPDQIRKLCGGDAYLENLAKKISGLSSQSEYLRQLAVTRVAPLMEQMRGDMERSTSKLASLEEKQRRGKRVVVSNSDLHSATFDRDKWQKRQSKITQTRGQIAGFNRYDSGDLVREFLWWDVMTKAARGDDLPAVSAFRKEYPSWSYSAGSHHRHHHSSSSRRDRDYESAMDLAASGYDYDYDSDPS